MVLVLRRPIESAGFMRTYASSSCHIVDAVSVWSIATLLTWKILDSLSLSPVQQFSVTLWPSARLNHDYTIIVGDSARVSERVLNPPEPKWPPRAERLC